VKTAAVAKLKAGLSEYLAMVKDGEEIIVTDRGKPIAKISPLKRNETDISVHLKRLEKAGLVRIGHAVSKDIFKLPRLSDKNGSALKALIDERENSR
jgi:prevent-host-death family protein